MAKVIIDSPLPARQHRWDAEPYGEQAGGLSRE
jgi:hypothetical protein